ncbi:MAG: exopolyphosphatase, partial [Gemmatimonadetes bacterium]|nr:exopolyphosphatase [Gemmatimonadota bacterium]
MVIARAQGHELTVIDRLREPVRLAEGLLPDGTLDPNVQARAVDCLKRFGERLRELPAGQVRAVGTNTLRKASRDLGFRSRAKDALGHAIEIVSGQEEARLIYQGICHAQPYAGRRLAVDIGGGSTEIIVGAGLEVLRAHSLYMGCVSYSKRFFPDGALTRDAFREAETAVALELRGAREELRGMHWETSIGSSGTINAISELLRDSQGGPEITLP